MEKKIERELMTEEEFDDYIKNGNIYLPLITPQAVHRFKSIRRAIRRGHATIEGLVIPKRPCNNRRLNKYRIERRESAYGRFRGAV